MSTSTKSAFLRCFLKGTRIHLGIQKPVDVVTGRVRDLREHLSARPVLRLLELDEVLPCDAADQLAEAIV